MTVQKITLDTEKTTPIYEYPITLRQGDTSIQIPVEITDNFVTKDLSNTKLAFYSDKPDATTIEDDEQSHFQIGADKKSFTYTFPDELTDASGSTTNTYFKIGNDSTSNFYIHILTKAGMEKLESGDYISKVDRIFNHVMSDYTAINDLAETGAATCKATIDKMNSDYIKFVNSKDAEFKTYLANLDKQAADIKSKLTTVKSQLDALKVPQFGARNLLANTGAFSTGTGPITHGGGTWDNKHVLMQDVPSSGNADLWTSQTVIYATGNCYTLSFWAKADTEGNTFNCYFFSPNTTTTYYTSQGKQGNNADGTIPITLSKVWSKYWITWNQTPSNEYKKIIVGRVNSDSVNLGKVYMTNPILVEGNQPVDWRPALEDYSKVTAENGDLEYKFYQGNTVDFKKAIWDLPLGFHTIYVQAGVINNPSLNALRGYVHITDKNDGNHIGNGVLVDSVNGSTFSVTVSCPNGTTDYSDKTSVIFNMLVKDSNTSNWQKQKITSEGAAYLIKCPSTTDFVEFLKSSSVPMGFSIIRDDHDYFYWKVIKESSEVFYASSQSPGGLTYHISAIGGKLSERKSMFDDFKGKTITATDDTGKTVKLKITGIS